MCGSLGALCTASAPVLVNRLPVRTSPRPRHTHILYGITLRSLALWPLLLSPHPLSLCKVEVQVLGQALALGPGPGRTVLWAGARSRAGRRSPVRCGRL